MKDRSYSQENSSQNGPELRFEVEAYDLAKVWVVPSYVDSKLKKYWANMLNGDGRI